MTPRSDRSAPTSRTPPTWVRHRWWIAVAALAAVVALFPLSRRVTTDRSVRGMFADDDPVAVEQDRFDERLPTRPVVMLVYADDRLATEAGLERNRRLTKAAEQVPGVVGVLSSSALNDIVSQMRPLVGGPVLFRRDHKVSIGFETIFAGYTHGENRDVAAVVAMIERDDADRTVGALRALASGWRHNAGEIAVVGEPVLIDDAFALIERDGRRLAWLVMAVLGAVVLIGTGDWRAVVYIGLTIGSAVIATRAAMAAIGLQISLVSTLLTAVLTIIAAASAIHLTVRLNRRGTDLDDDARGTLRGRNHGLTRVAKDLAAPVFWTIATTAGGFLALRVSRIRPVESFGLMVAIGCGFAALFLAAYYAATLGLRDRGVATHRRWLDRASRQVKKLCHRAAAASVRFRWAIIAVALLVTAWGGWTTSAGRVDSNFLSNFRSDSGIVAAYTEVEQRLGGIGVWDVLLPAPDALDADFMRDVRQFESDLRDLEFGEHRILQTLSLADADRVAMEAPLMRYVTPDVRLKLMRQSLPTFYEALITEPAVDDDAKADDPRGGRWLRIMLRSDEAGSSEDKLGLASEVHRLTEAFVADRPELNGRRGIVGGYHVLMAGLVGSLIEDQWRCLVASMIAVAFLLAVAVRGPVESVAALLPSVLPVFVVLGWAARGGGVINMGAAMIAAVSIGLSIDGSVHLLTRRRRLMDRGWDRYPATVSAAGDVALPVLLATAGLVAGFATLSTSEFVPTATFGRLLAVSMAVATLTNLTVLPALVGGPTVPLRGGVQPARENPK